MKNNNKYKNTIFFNAFFVRPAVPGGPDGRGPSVRPGWSGRAGETEHNETMCKKYVWGDLGGFSEGFVMFCVLVCLRFLMLKTLVKGLPKTLIKGVPKTLV